jgi:hypothetical protein
MCHTPDNIIDLYAHVAGVLIVVKLVLEIAVYGAGGSLLLMLTKGYAINCVK